MTTKRLALLCLVLAGCGMPMILADGGLLNGDDAGNQMMGGEDGGADAGPTRASTPGRSSSPTRERMPGPTPA